MKFKVKEFIPVEKQDERTFNTHEEAVKEMERLSEGKEEHLFIIEAVGE